MKIAKTVIIAYLATITAVSMAWAQTPEQKGLEIATAADQRDSGWKHMTADMEMVLRNRSGKE